MTIRIVLRDLLHDRGLRKTDADNQIIAAFRERTHRRLNRSRIAGFNVANNDVEWLLLISLLIQARLSVRMMTSFGTLYANPSGCIERAVVFTPDIKDDTNANLVWIVSAVTNAVTCAAAANQ